MKKCMKITLTDTSPSIFESKIKGLGYIPHDESFPFDSTGRQLRLLAQIECDKIELDEFPKTGLLQFWILCDDISGLNFSNPVNQDGFRVIYYPEIDKTVTEEEVRSKFAENDYDTEYADCFPAQKECGMVFEKGENRFIDADASEEAADEAYDEYIGHKTGGYPFFTQEDPRTCKEELEQYDYLLFQLDTDDENGIMWGDSGIGNFFINSEKLKNCDFSDVLYNWDCY